MEDLHAKFLPQFVSLARSRIELAIKAVADRDHAAISKIGRDLHTLAGEAGLLGLHDVVPLARDGELKARVLHASRTDADADVLAAALRQLERIIDGIGTPLKSGS
jgi:HPt (histidine-containing phosphotransfer) domain-containing protein